MNPACPLCKAKGSFQIDSKGKGIHDKKGMIVDMDYTVSLAMAVCRKCRYVLFLWLDDIKV